MQGKIWDGTGISFDPSVKGFCLLAKKNLLPDYAGLVVIGVEAPWL